MNQSIENAIRTAPQGAGVYVFMNGDVPLYVGKARNLRQRLSSYLREHDTKTTGLSVEATTLRITPLDSEIEALIHESRYIKTHHPKYNVVFKDDKSYVYVYLSSDPSPKIGVIHKSAIDAYKTTIGPFTDSGALRKTLKIIRRYFSYCTCARLHKRTCINAQMNNCPGFCCRENRTPTKEEEISYKKNIATIKAILRGRTKYLQSLLKKEITAAAQREDYRAAAALRDRYYALQKIFAHRLYLNEQTNMTQERNENNLLSDISTAECYDTSHLAGKEAVGALTAWERNKPAKKDWQPEKTRWRTFRIHWAPTQDDPRMIREIVSRRLAHREWAYPGLIIIDGGTTQFLAAKSAIGDKPIRLISFAKPRALVHGIEEQPIPLARLSLEEQNFILRAINETHRFAIGFHRRTRAKQFLGTKSANAERRNFVL